MCEECTEEQRCIECIWDDMVDDHCTIPESGDA